MKIADISDSSFVHWPGGCPIGLVKVTTLNLILKLIGRNFSMHQPGRNNLQIASLIREHY